MPCLTSQLPAWLKKAQRFCDGFLTTSLGTYSLGFSKVLSLYLVEPDLHVGQYVPPLWAWSGSWIWRRSRVPARVISSADDPSSVKHSQASDQIHRGIGDPGSAPGTFSASKSGVLFCAVSFLAPYAGDPNCLVEGDGTPNTTTSRRTQHQLHRRMHSSN